MNNIKNKSEKKLLLDRVHRIRGQVEGIEKMIDQDKACVETINQIMAVRSALAKVATKILTQESCKTQCQQDKKSFENIVNKLLNFK